MDKQDVIKILELRLQQTLLPTTLVIEDEGHHHTHHAAGKAGLFHLHVILSSPLFRRKSLIECHRMVYEATGDLLPNPLHALRITVATSNET